ncbi:hypothetical protein HanRHA438_Chr12g0532441 [Helianthus annuus]|nr:hypothetical protein HanRHA438_Chr12g0532441 [Helianthus annuus]
MRVGGGMYVIIYMCVCVNRKEIKKKKKKQAGLGPCILLLGMAGRQVVDSDHWPLAMPQLLFSTVWNAVNNIWSHCLIHFLVLVYLLEA